MKERTLREKIQEESNDYGEIESIFYRRTGEELIKEEKTKIKLSGKSASVLIPLYNDIERAQQTVNALGRQEFNRENELEIILIDDGSKVDILKELNLVGHHKVIKIHCKVNQGYGIPHNIGIYFATSEVIICLDGDMVPPPNFVTEHVLRHSIIDNILLVGFKENIALEDFKKTSRDADFKKDPRYSKDTKKYGLKEKVINIYEETAQFKRFGHNLRLHEDCLPGGWTLPEIVATHNLSIRRKNAIRIGGFDEAFSKNWGYNDTYFAARAIAEGLYIVPCISAPCFHIDHPPRNCANDEERRKGLEKNKEKYQKKIEERYIPFSEKRFMKSIEKYLRVIEIK